MREEQTMRREDFEREILAALEPAGVPDATQLARELAERLGRSLAELRAFGSDPRSGHLGVEVEVREVDGGLVVGLRPRNAGVARMLRRAVAGDDAA